MLAGVDGASKRRHDRSGSRPSPRALCWFGRAAALSSRAWRRLHSPGGAQERTSAGPSRVAHRGEAAALAEATRCLLRRGTLTPSASSCMVTAWRPPAPSSSERPRRCTAAFAQQQSSDRAQRARLLRQVCDRVLAVDHSSFAAESGRQPDMTAPGVTQQCGDGGPRGWPARARRSAAKSPESCSPPATSISPASR